MENSRDSVFSSYVDQLRDDIHHASDEVKNDRNDSSSSFDNSLLNIQGFAGMRDDYIEEDSEEETSSDEENEDRKKEESDGSSDSEAYIDYQSPDR